jgi:hypothetical protein
VPAPAPVTASAPPAPPRRKTSIDLFWIGGWVGVGASVVGFGVAVGTGAAMVNNVSTRDQLCPQYTKVCRNPTAVSADFTARADQAAVFVSGGIGLAALGAGVSLLVMSPRKVIVVPVVGPTLAGLGLHGTF